MLYGSLAIGWHFLTINPVLNLEKTKQILQATVRFRSLAAYVK